MSQAVTWSNENFLTLENEVLNFYMDGTGFEMYYQRSVKRTGLQRTDHRVCLNIRKREAQHPLGRDRLSTSPSEHPRLLCSLKMLSESSPVHPQHLRLVEARQPASFTASGPSPVFPNHLEAAAQLACFLTFHFLLRGTLGVGNNPSFTFLLLSLSGHG